MKPDRWQKLDELFQSALELAPDERAAFLDEGCAGDEELRERLDALLAAHDKAGSFIESPALEVEGRLLAKGESEIPGEAMVGKTIGHFRVIDVLGSGGMGEVYLAQDLKLGRKVALKLLPNRFTQDVERLRRFEQEARTASALNHPNIVTIYEIGEVGEIHFIATEFIDGLTLRQQLSGGPMEMLEALDISLQIAGALTAAHARGIIHRDIKPENIMVLKESYSGRRERHIKVLDFGIAKLIEPGSLHTEMPTRPLVNTLEGLAVGTMPYMSPEQVRGDQVDARTDIWSLGVLLYEMLAGRMPFAGDKPQEINASILRDETPPLPPEIPESLRWIVKKALRKNREERYQTAREMLSDLRDLQEQTTEERKAHSAAVSPSAATSAQHGAIESQAPATQARESAGPTASSAEYHAGEIKRNRWGVFIALALGLSAVVVTILGVAKLINRDQGNRDMLSGPSSSMKITRLTDTGQATTAAISPDGQYFVYVRANEGKQSLWLRQVASTGEKEILPPAEVKIGGPMFSHDGNLVYYTASQNNNAFQGILYQVPTLGGTPRRVIDNVLGPVGLSPDGKRVAFNRTLESADSVIIANVDGSNEKPVTTRTGQGYFAPGPAWSPDGKVIACGAGVEPEFADESVMEISVDSGKEKWITRQRWAEVGRVVWLGDGSGLIVVARERESPWQLWQVSYPGGDVRKLTNDLNGYVPQSLTRTTDSNTLVAVQEDTTSRIWITAPGEDESRARQITNGKFDGLRGLSWTPEGRIVCVLKTGDHTDIWLMNVDGAERRQLTADRFSEGMPEMSPNGRYVVFTSDRSGYANIWRMDADGSNQKQLTPTGYGDFGARLTPDGKWIVFGSWRWPGLWKIGRVSIDGGEPVRLTDYPSFGPALSPDGKLIAAGYLDENNAGHIAVIPFEGGPPLKSFDRLPGVKLDSELGWTSDGKALLSIEEHNGISNLWSQPIDGGRPKPLTNFKSDLIFRFALSRNGRQLALARGTQTHDVVLIRDFR